MTDEEILKAFQLCNTDTDCDTNGCPYNDMVEDCISMLNNDIISRFNELKAENAALRERLEKAVELREPRITVDHWGGLYEVVYEKVQVVSEVYDTRSEAEARLAELEGKEE